MSDASVNLAARLFRIRPGEGRRAAAMLVYSVALVGAVVITGQLAGRALFLSELPRSAIPYKFMLPPLVLMVVSALYTRVAGRLRRDRLIVVTCVLSAVGILGFRVLLATPAGHELAALCALFVFIDVVGDLTILQFWTFAGDIFDAREAKRLFGLIAGGSAVSNVLFGAVLAGTAKAVDPADLLFVIAAGLLVCLGAVLYIVRVCRQELPAEALQAGDAGTTAADGGRQGLLADLRTILGQPLVRTIGAIVLLVALASGMAEYVLDLALQRHYAGDGQAMVAFLGRFRLLAGIASGVLQFFLAGRLLERFGVVAGLALLPATMALGSGAVFLAAGALWAAALPRACDVVLKYTVHNAAVNLLYLPIEPALRARAKAVLDGIVRPPMLGLLGVAFLFADRWAPPSPQQWALPLLAVVGAWLLLLRPAARQYVAALTRSLRLRRLDLDAEPLDLADDSSVRVVRDSLRADDEGRVLHALYLVQQIPNVDFTAHLVPLASHPSAQVRRSALRQLAMAGGEVGHRAIRAALDDDELDIRGVAVEEACVAGIASADEEAGFLAAVEARIRAAAALGLLRRGGMAALERVRPPLTALLEDAAPAVRLEGVRAVRYLGEPQMAPFLIPRLGDQDLTVRGTAVRGAIRMPSPALVPALVPALAHASLKADAGRAIGLCVATDLTPATDVIGDRGQPLAIRAALLRVLGDVGHPDVPALLLAQLAEGEAPLRLAACQALLARHRAGAVSPEATVLQPLLDREVRAGYRWDVALQITVRGPGTLLLREALQVRYDETCARILILLDLIHPELTEERLRPSLQGHDRRARAAALELLDSVLPHEQGAVLVPLLSPRADERREGAQRAGIPVPAPAAQLAALEADEDPWVRRCARNAAGLTTGAATTGAATTGDDDMALSNLERVFFLKSVSFFQPIPGDQIDRFVSILKEVSFAVGETFIRRGDQGDCLYIIVEGEVEVRRDDQVFTHRTTEVIGERSVLTESPRTADCTAATDVVALRIDKDDFWDLMREQPGLTIEVMRVVVDRYVPAVE